MNYKEIENSVSKCCSKCGNQMMKVKVGTTPLIGIKRKKSFIVLYKCKESSCNFNEEIISYNYKRLNVSQL